MAGIKLWGSLIVLSWGLLPTTVMAEPLKNGTAEVLKTEPSPSAADQAVPVTPGGLPAPPAASVECLQPDPYLHPALDPDFTLEATPTEAETETNTADTPLPESADSDDGKHSNFEQVITLDGVKSPETEAPVESSESEAETDSIDSSAAEEPETETIPPETLARWQTLAKADFYYQCGEMAIAEKFYQEVKPPFEAETNTQLQFTPEPIYDAENLSGAGHVYWRLYQEGLESETYTSKRLSALQLMTERHPEFIPAHLAYAELMASQGDVATQQEILQNALSQYPNESQLVNAQIALAEQEERWLDASIAARQFSVFNSDHHFAPEFRTSADTNLERHTNQLKNRLAWNNVGNVILGSVGYALTGNLFGPLSATQTTLLLIQGEDNLGDRFSAQIRNQVPLMEDEMVLDYVRRIGNELATVAGRDEFNYEFYVVMDDRLNAFALPGGKIFINAGAILKTETEAELAGLVAHELAHAVLSHGFQQMTQGALTMNVTQYIPFVGRSAGDLLVLNYSRDMETQADIFGTQLLTATDYAADGVRNLMETMAEEDLPAVPAWLSTHPNTGDRVEYIEIMIVQNQLNRYAYEGIVEHQRIQARVKALLKQFQSEQAEE